jgi:hypothetical protein
MCMPIIHDAMRTTIELDETQRSELLRIAGARGEKGFSAVVREALDYYLAHHSGRGDAIRAALGVRGALSEKEATALATEVRRNRETWR